MADASRQLAGVLAWLAYVLDDEARTKRLRSVLYLVLPAGVLVVVALAALLLLSPTAAAMVGGGISLPAGIAAVRETRRRRQTSQPPSQRPSHQPDIVGAQR